MAKTFLLFPGGLHAIGSLREKKKDLKVIIGLGGWVEGSVKYSEMAAVKTKRDKFIRSVKNFLT